MKNVSFPINYDTILCMHCVGLWSQGAYKGYEGLLLEIHKAKFSRSILFMVYAMQRLGQILDNPVIFHCRMTYYGKRVYQSGVWLKLFEYSFI